MGRTFAREPGRCACPRSLRECPEALFYEALARALDCDATGRDLLRNFLIAEPFIRFQQDAGTRHGASCGLARSDEGQEGFPFLRGQIHTVFLGWHRIPSIPEFSLPCPRCSPIPQNFLD